MRWESEDCMGSPSPLLGDSLLFVKELWGYSLVESEVKVKVAQPCLTLCNPVDYTVHGILQARILEWVAFSLSRGSSQPRGWTQFSCIAGRFFTSWATREAWGVHGGQTKADAGRGYTVATGHLFVVSLRKLKSRLLLNKVPLGKPGPGWVVFLLDSWVELVF